MIGDLKHVSSAFSILNPPKNLLNHRIRKPPSHQGLKSPPSYSLISRSEGVFALQQSASRLQLGRVGELGNEFLNHSQLQLDPILPQLLPNHRGAFASTRLLPHQHPGKALVIYQRSTHEVSNNLSGNVRRDSFLDQSSVDIVGGALSAVQSPQSVFPALLIEVVMSIHKEQGSGLGRFLV